MRVIKSIPHDLLSIQLMQWNGKYIVKLEAGPYEQIYKIAETEVLSLDGLEKNILEKLAPAAKDIFREMSKAGKMLGED